MYILKLPKVFALSVLIDAIPIVVVDVELVTVPPSPAVSRPVKLAAELFRLSVTVPLVLVDRADTSSNKSVYVLGMLVKSIVVADDPSVIV
jgi:hypothetical protein